MQRWIAQAGSVSIWKIKSCAKISLQTYRVESSYDPTGVIVSLSSTETEGFTIMAMLRRRRNVPTRMPSVVAQRPQCLNLLRLTRREAVCPEDVPPSTRLQAATPHRRLPAVDRAHSPDLAPVCRPP
ncbi:hypothetical protein BD310DRAFT_940932 [Dichomitus squalens]|uniref:Uncharacterized protein n=1 Tax=Dichomitus squalens TaxID=114155 RepID=A0A4Q9PG38_9APHY|nr:hypothetical protein BD310DRAFT_940932 [Dichomitus squalens]